MTIFSVRAALLPTALLLSAAAVILAGCKGSETSGTGTASGGAPAASGGPAVFAANGCGNCHSVGGAPAGGGAMGGPGGGGGGMRGPGGGPGRGGGGKGPSLASIGADASKTADWLIAHIKDPKTHNPSSGMPGFDGKINDADLKSLADYLITLKG